MYRRILPIFLAMVLLAGAAWEPAPALARRGSDDSSRGEVEDNRRGRGRGQDDVFENHRSREGRKGQHHLQGEDHPRSRDRSLSAPDDSKGRDGSRGRGQDDR